MVVIANWLMWCQECLREVLWACSSSSCTLRTFFYSGKQALRLCWWLHSGGSRAIPWWESSCFRVYESWSKFKTGIVCGVHNVKLESGSPWEVQQFLWIIYKISGARKVALDLMRSTEKAGSLASSPRSSKVVESMYKYLQTHIEVLELCISKSANK